MYTPRHTPYLLTSYAKDILLKMPKAGKYDYPIKDLDECIRHLQKAWNEGAQENTLRRELFAESLEMSPRGGGFGALVGSMAQYGLIETGEGFVRITESGKSIILGEPEEQAQAKSDAVRHVKLFDEITNKFGSDCTEKNLRLFLRQKAGVDISEAARLASEIRKLLNKNNTYLKSDGNKKTSSGGDSELMTEEELEFNNSKGQVITPLFRISLVSKKAVDNAITLLQQFRDDLFPDQKESKTESNVKDSENSSNRIKGEKDSTKPT